jgi:hypothetical protein
MGQLGNFDKLVLLFAIILGLGLGIERAFGHHNVKLPLVPDTPAIHNVWDYGALMHCLNARASNYPGFRAQVQTVLDADWPQMPVGYVVMGATFESASAAYAGGCNVWHEMPDDPNFCSGCAARVFYANWPVTVQYKWSLGFSDWKSADGHEYGHVLGLHEQYVDSGGISCGWSGSVSVMDCGSPFLYVLQPFDVANLLTWLPAPGVSSGGLAFHEGDPFVWYCDGDPNAARADQTAVFYYDHWSDSYYWSGLVYGVARGGCQNQGTWIYCDGASQREIYLNEQISGWPWSSWHGPLRNDTYVGTCP